MNKLALSFCAGAAIVAAAAYMAGTHTARLMFAIGTMTPTAIAALYLKSADRMRQAAAFLNRVADVVDGAQTRTMTGRRAVASTQAAGELTGVALDVATAIRNFGATRKQAEELARRTADQMPGATFEAMFRAAMKARQEAA